MLYYKKYVGHEFNIIGKKIKYDDTIYSFDIETSSYLILNGKIYQSSEYLNLTEKERKDSLKQSNMYIWMCGINEKVYYGRTWNELKEFFEMINRNSEYRKIFFVHNLSYEFQYLSGFFSFTEVKARKIRKVMSTLLQDFNIEFRCTYMMSNAALAQLPKLFQLPVEKKVGDLDYTLIRHSLTPLTKKELDYCEYDCLVVYEYIKKELQEYEYIYNIPRTSTGHVRRELKDLTYNDISYRRAVYKAINVNPHIYNMLIEAFAGGYSHANWVYTDSVLNNVDSWDFTSSYPFVMVSEKYPSTEFKQCKVSKREDLLSNFAYLLKVRFFNIKCKYLNNFISSSKCLLIKNAKYDNGRIIKAEEILITLTDIDFKFICDSYDIESYDIEESFFSIYKYLPKSFIEFILKKYVLKTQYKGVAGKELEYSKEKNKYNALYGMSVTNLIRDRVLYEKRNDWETEHLTNEEITELLEKEKKKSFLSFAYGVWVTAYARNNLLRNIIDVDVTGKERKGLDEYVIYCDTDSIKLKDGYNINIINDYNNIVMDKLKTSAEKMDIDLSSFMPADKKGILHPLGVFDSDGHYSEFITQGAKKYAYRSYDSIYGFKRNYFFKNENQLHITVAGVPKQGVVALKDNIKNFKDDLIFDYNDTGKNLLIYNDEQIPVELTDYTGKKMIVNDKKGSPIFPTTYILKKALEYAELVGDSSERSKYLE